MNRALHLHLLLSTLLHPLYLHAQRYDYQSDPYSTPSPLGHHANLYDAWINRPLIEFSYRDGAAVRAILLHPRYHRSYGPTFACGLYCMYPCSRSLFSVFIVTVEENYGWIDDRINGTAQVVWSANRDRPVNNGAYMNLTGDGDLVLYDVDGSLAWSTNTAGRGVVGMNITALGNLVLFNAKNMVVWQSFDHPTDTLLSGQSLVEGQRLTANATTAYWNRGQFYITHTPDGFQAFIDSNPPQLYFGSLSKISNIKSVYYPCFLNVTSKVLTFVSNSSSPSDPRQTPPNVSAFTIQFLRLESDGRMVLYEWGPPFEGWHRTADVIRPYLGDCAFPTACGSYGICLSGNCRCPRAANESTTFFKPVNDTLPNLGCFPITPLSCKPQEQHQFLDLEGVSYFNYIDDTLRDFTSTTAERCKEACLRNCTCKAALFKYGSNASNGSCYLPQEIFSLMTNLPQTSRYNSTAHIKVLAPPTSSPSPLSSNSNGTSTPLIVGASVGSVLGVLLIVSIAISVYRKNNKTEEDNYDEEDLAPLPGTSTRFSYEDLKRATENFVRKLGSGGFGSVFDGTLVDGTTVAVKQLESVRQGKREFLAEVETIGSIHHLNLVRLIGFCMERSHRLLVYEYMSNGSLDKWIFGRAEDEELSWEIRSRIIQDVAKGLLYLHEECRQKIAHLDIKPQNILLDSNFNAKVSDFGLAKLIDRDQSAVVTMMRGTPGYLAPEWLTSKITEKVDVYSFGVVIVEIVCGKRNLDHSRGEESMHLLSLLKEKATMGLLLDVLDRRCNDTQINEEMEKMLKLAIWCLQYDTSKRPSMSIVVKVLDGALDIAKDIDYDFTTPVQRFEHRFVDTRGSTPLLASELSGPR